MEKPRLAAVREGSLMDARCRIELLGDVRIVREDRIVTRFRTRKTAHLLACLALPPGRSHHREALIDHFWPDLDLDAGRNSLNLALTALRKALETDGIPPGAVLLTDRRSAHLNPAAVTTDLLEIEELTRRAEETPDPSARAAVLERAVSLCRGDLVPDCYDDWLLSEQRRWRERSVDALLAWSRALEEAGDPTAALEAAGRAAADDPLREEACARRIRLYAALGRHADARVCYRDYERRLKEEGGDEPAPILHALAEQLRVDPGPRPLATASPPLVPAKPSGEPAVFPLEAVVMPRFAPSPSPLSRFVGREAEIDWLGRQLELDQTIEEEFPRLITVTGLGGTGKTRLAIEIARRVDPSYAGRVAFVALDALDNPRRVIGAVARALGLSVPVEDDGIEAVASALGDAPVLLVLDNLEHLLADTGPDDGRAVVRGLLARIPSMRCLVTSRQALAIDGERELRLAPLSIPVEAGMACESVALFRERARAIDPDFDVTDENAADVAALCDRLEGLPLAIEMAAAWTRVLPPRRLLERLERQPNDLTDRRKDAPDRHRSLRATLEYSHELLDPDLRRIFAALSVFRGGWTLDGAEAVCGDEALGALADLAERSLLATDEARGRYRYLEIVRDYARERLRESGEAEARSRHARHFLRMATEAAARAPGLDPGVWAALREDFANLNEALEWLVESGGAEELARIVTALEAFWVEEGHHLTDGTIWADRALSLHSTRDEARQLALRTAGWLAFRRDRYVAARAFYEESRSIASERGDSRGFTNASIGLARLSAEEGDPEGARRRIEECESMLRSLDDPSALMEGLFDTAGVMRSLGAEEEEERRLNECAGLMRALGRRRDLAKTLYSLASLARSRGDTERAWILWEECVTIDESLGVRGGGALWGLGTLAEDRGDREEASRWYGRSLRENRESGNHRGLAEGLLTLALDGLARDAPERSARLLGASLRQRSLTDHDLAPLRRTQAGLLSDRLRQRLGDDSFEALWREGWQMGSGTAITHALEGITGRSVPEGKN